MVQPHSFDKMKQRVLLGGYSSEVPPLPIPNREVKLTHADGTAYLGGRVGSRLFKPSPNKGSVFLYMYVISCRMKPLLLSGLKRRLTPLTLTFPPLCPLPLAKGGALVLVAECLLLFFLHIVPYLLHKT